MLIAPSGDPLRAGLPPGASTKGDIIVRAGLRKARVPSFLVTSRLPEFGLAEMPGVLGGRALDITLSTAARTTVCGVEGKQAETSAAVCSREGWLESGITGGNDFVEVDLRS